MGAMTCVFCRGKRIPAICCTKDAASVGSKLLEMLDPWILLRLICGML